MQSPEKRNALRPSRLRPFMPHWHWKVLGKALLLPMRLHLSILNPFQSEEAVLTDLSVDRNYEISVSAVNSQGAGPGGTPAVVWVGEAVPTAPPAEVAAEPLSPTEVALSWRPPSLAHQNGDLLGYKVNNINKTNRNTPEGFHLSNCSTKRAIKY